MKKNASSALWFCALALLCARPNKSRGEAMLQYFNTDWNEIAQKMPELAEAG